MERSFPKCPICVQPSGYFVSGIFQNYFQCKYCRAKWKLTFAQGQLTSLILHELPKNGQGLWRVEGLNAPLFVVLGHEYPVDFWSKLKLVNGVDWDSLSKCVPPAVASAAIMGKGERTLACWSGCVVISRPLSGEWADSLRKY